MPNADKVQPAVPVVINGKQETLLFDLWADRCLSEELGDGWLQNIGTNFTASRLLTVVWALLIATHDELDGETSKDRRKAQKTVAKWCSQNTDLKQVADAVLEAFRRAMPVKKEGSDEKNEQAAPVEESTG